LISESLEGVRVAEARQNAGMFLKDGGCLPFAGGRGDVKAPAATVAAPVILTFWSFKAVRLSQADAPKTGAIPKAAIVNRIAVRIMVGGSILAYYHARFDGKDSIRNLEASGSSPPKIRKNISARTE